MYSKTHRGYEHCYRVHTITHVGYKLVIGCIVKHILGISIVIITQYVIVNLKTGIQHCFKMQRKTHSNIFFHGPNDHNKILLNLISSLRQ